MKVFRTSKTIGLGIRPIRQCNDVQRHTQVVPQTQGPGGRLQPQRFFQWADNLIATRRQVAYFPPSIRMSAWTARPQREQSAQIIVIPRVQAFSPMELQRYGQKPYRQ